jgi:predicted CoA-binding protein
MTVNHETEEDVMREVLRSTRRIAMVGASPDPERDSYGVMRFLLQQGYEVFPVNPAAGADEILGQKVHGSLADVPKPVDMVDVFRRSEAAGAVCDEAVEVGAKAVWMQLGVLNEPAAARAREAGLKVVMNRCPKIEMPRLGIRGPGA